MRGGKFGGKQVRLPAARQRTVVSRKPAVGATERFFAPLPHAPKQRLFVAEYLVDLNGTQAARSGPAKSKESAQQIASESPSKPDIGSDRQGAGRVRRHNPLLE